MGALYCTNAWRAIYSKVLGRVEIWLHILRGVWWVFPNNNFQFLNNISRIFTYFFHSHVFPQKFLNNNFQFLNTWTKQALSTCLDTDNLLSVCVFQFSFSFENRVSTTILLFQQVLYIVYETYKYLFFNRIFIKNRSLDTIHTFKNYFVTVFSVFSKINGI